MEGTWVGAPELESIPRSTTVFGSAMVDDGSGIVLVPPSHPLERLYLVRSPGVMLVSNSFAWLLEAAGLELLPDALYPQLFVAAAEGVRPAPMAIPTTGAPVEAIAHHNVRLTPPGRIEFEERPDEAPFGTYEEYRRRLGEALRSAVANAPGYEMVATVSSGYDSTAVAVVAAEAGCRRAVTFATSKPLSGGGSPDDSGRSTALRLGMDVREFDRLAYRGRSDLPEAEFLATGMSGEDVVFVAMEDSIGRSILLTGSEEFRLKGNPYRPGMYRGDLSSCSLTEFRVRRDFVHLPLLFFGASQQPSLIRIIESAQMRRFVMPGLYDKPIQRRIAEDGGLPRGSFATVKRRSSAALHASGLAAMAPASAAAVRAFAAQRGLPIDDRRRFSIKRRHRFVIRLSKKLRVPRLARGIVARRRALIHFEPEFGSLLLLWAVTQVRPRYARPGSSTGLGPSVTPVLSVQAASSEGVAARVGDRP